MTTMTDEAAKEIAEKTVKKFGAADKNVCFILNEKSSCEVLSTIDEDRLVEVAINLIFKLLGDDAEAAFKDAAKQVKELRKKEKKDAKRKKRA